MAAGGGKGNSGAVRAGRAFVEISGNDKSLRATLKAIPAQFKAIGATISKVGLGIGAAGSAIYSPFAVLANHFIEAGSAATDMAARLGTSTETVTALGYAAELAGTGIEDVEASLGKMQKAIAEGGTKNITLGEELLDMSLEEQLDAVADAIAAIDNPAQQAAAAMELFGKSGRKMLPFLRDGAAGLAALRGQAGRDGAIIGKDEADKADRVGDALGRVWTVAKSIGRAIGGAFLPGADSAEDFAERISSVGVAVRNFIAQNAKIFRVIGLVGAGLLAAGAAVTAFGAVVMGVGAALSAVTTVFGAIAGAVMFLASPLGLITAGLVALAAGLAMSIGESSDFQGMIADIGATFTTTWSGIQDAIAGGDLSLAAEIAWNGVKQVFSRGVGELGKIWIGFKFFFFELWEDIREAGAIAWTAIGTLAKGAVNVMVDGLNVMVDGINWLITQARKVGVDVGGTVDRFEKLDQSGDPFRKDLDEAKARRQALKDEKARQIAEQNAADPALTSEMESLRAKAWQARLDATPWMEFPEEIENAQRSLRETGGPVRGAFGAAANSATLGFGDGQSISRNTEKTARNTERTNKLLEKFEPAMVED